MTFNQFHNALRILLNIDRHDLDQVGVILDDKDWCSFRDNPHRWFIKAEGQHAEGLWTIIEERQKR